MRLIVHRFLVALVLLATLSACGVRPQQHPEIRGTPPSDAPSVHPSPPGEATLGAAGIVYLVQGTRLVAAKRSAEPPADAVAALLLGPTVGEARRGIRTAVPAGIAELDVRIRDGIALIDVPTELTDLAGSAQIMAIAQLVFTVTESAAVGGVVLTRADRQIHAPIDSGQLVSRPVTRADYRSVQPA